MRRKSSPNGRKTMIDKLAAAFRPLLPVFGIVLHVCRPIGKVESGAKPNLVSDWPTQLAIDQLVECLASNVP